MNNKGKLQLGDALPGAVQIFAKALDLTEDQLFKQMEQGRLVSSEVLPKVAKAYKDAAMEGGAYEKALKGLRVTEGQFITQAQRAGKTIFDGGFEKGLSNLFKTLNEALKGVEPQLRKIGLAFGKFFDGVAYGIKLITPVFKVMIDNMEWLLGGAVIMKLRTLSLAFTSFGVALKSAFLPITAALMATEELISLLSDDVRGALETSIGSQINLITGETSELKKVDGGYAKGKVTGTTDEMLTSFLGFKPLELLKNIDMQGAQGKIDSWMIENLGYDRVNKPLLGQPSSQATTTVSTGDITIKVDGSGSPVETAKVVRQEIDNMLYGSFKGAGN